MFISRVVNEPLDIISDVSVPDLYSKPLDFARPICLTDELLPLILCLLNLCLPYVIILV